MTEKPRNSGLPSVDRRGLAGCIVRSYQFLIAAPWFGDGHDDRAVSEEALLR
jgi:hypothetical protein